MSAKFFRLYRAIADDGGRQSMSAVDSTYAFEIERRETLDSLGFKVGYKDAVLNRNKHHGKLARNKINTKSSQVATYDDKGLELLEWKKNYHVRLKEINKYQSLALEMTEALRDNKNVSNSLWRKFDTTSSLIDDKGAKKIVHGSGKSFVPDSELPNIPYTPVNDVQNKNLEHQRREQLTAPKLKWTSQEKRKINDLYLEIERPAANSTVSWNLYYQMFVVRFLESYPNHNANEVRMKVEQMLALRQVKMSGEEEYWRDQVRKTPTTNLSHTLPKSATKKILPPQSKLEKSKSFLPKVQFKEEKIS